MDEPNSDDSVVKSFDRALWLIAARRQNTDSAFDNEWLWDEIRQLRVQGNDPSEYLESVGKLIGALIEVSSFFLTGWARSSGEDPEAIIALTRRICEEQSTNRGSNSGSGPLRSQECPG